jgi:hypothetical protein
MVRWSWSVPTAVVVLLAATPAAAQRPGQQFRSPLRNFAVTVPNLTFGTDIQKRNDRDGGTVSFVGGMGDLRRIDYHRLPNAAPEDMDELQALLREPVELLVQGSNGEILAEHPHETDGFPMRLSIVSFPEGSHLMNQQTGRRLDSVRGLLSFASGGFLYVLHIELAGPVWGGKPGAPLPGTADYVRRGTERLAEFYRTITLTGS